MYANAQGPNTIACILIGVLISDHLSKLSLEERREIYFCGKNSYKDIANIPTWEKQFNDHKKSLTEKGL